MLVCPNTRLTLSMGIPFESAKVANEWLKITKRLDIIRHAYGTRRIKQGKQLAVVQREMGHRCIQSTMTYIDTSSMIEQAQEAAENEEVRKIKPVWTGSDSLLAMYRNRFST